MTEPIPPNQAESLLLTLAPQPKEEEAEVSVNDGLPGVTAVAVDSPCAQGVAQTEAAAPVAPLTPVPPDDQTPMAQPVEMLQQLARLADMFDDKFRYDQVRDGIIDKLHVELQQHRNDMLGRVLLPVMRDLIYLHRALLTFVEARRAFPEEKRDWNNLLDNVATFGDDLTEILARNGVESFTEEGVGFNPRTQRALGTLPTEDASTDKTIAQRLRPGFRWGQQLIQNEEVIVHKLRPAVAPTSGDCPQ